MGEHVSDIAFTATVKAIQERKGSRAGYAKMEQKGGWRRAITADSALRLARYFGTTPEFWINLQAHYDLEVAKGTLRRQIEKEIEP